jgi:hypothetical protein
MKKLTVLLTLFLAIALIMAPAYAQKKVVKKNTTTTATPNTSNVHLFQSYFFDAPVASSGYGEGGLMYSSYEYLNTFGLGVQGGYPINDKIEVGTQLFYLNYSPEQGDGQSGISDLGVYGRYNIYNQNQTNFSAGGLVTLPIGSEDVGQGNLNFGFYGAVRHLLSNGLTLAGNLGLIFYETKEVEFNPNTFKIEEKTSHESYLNLGLGAIYPINTQFNIVGELNFHSEGDYMMLTGGADYLLGSGRLRGALGLGLDDGAPDFMLMGSYSIGF